MKTTIFALLTGLAAIIAAGTAAPAASASTGPARGSAAAVRPLANSSAQQLVFYDDLGTIYSIRVEGYNQNGVYTNRCFEAPGHTTVTWNWWWTARSYVYTYSQGGCPAGTATQELYFDPDGATQYRCLSDKAPYPDWSCPHP
jgi:hypothetical protein